MIRLFQWTLLGRPMASRGACYRVAEDAAPQTQAHALGEYAQRMEITAQLHTTHKVERGSGTSPMLPVMHPYHRASRADLTRSPETL